MNNIFERAVNIKIKILNKNATKDDMDEYELLKNMQSLSPKMFDMLVEKEAKKKI